MTEEMDKNHIANYYVSCLADWYSEELLTEILCGRKKVEEVYKIAEEYWRQNQ